jgi:hypothetical protein
MAARRWPFLYMSRDRREAVASSRGGHSSVTDVWVTLRSYGHCVSKMLLRKRGTDIDLRGFRRSLTKFFQNIALQLPELALSLLFFCDILRNGNVDNRARGGAGWEEERRELNEVSTFPQKDLSEIVKVRLDKGSKT